MYTLGTLNVVISRTVDMPSYHMYILCTLPLTSMVSFPKQLDATSVTAKQQSISMHCCLSDVGFHLMSSSSLKFVETVGSGDPDGLKHIFRKLL